MNPDSEMGMHGQRRKARRRAAFTPPQRPNDFVFANAADLRTAKRRKRRAPLSLQNQLLSSG